MSGFIDIHCHLEMCDPVGATIEKARKADVKVIVAQGTSPDSNRNALAYAKHYPEVKAALGLYPMDARTMSNAEIEKEFNFIALHGKEIAAIGEVGMDFKDFQSLRAIENANAEHSRVFKKDQKHDAHPILKDGVWESARALDARGATDALKGAVSVGPRHEQYEQQKTLFKKSIALAIALNKPLIVHSRKAEEACIALLEELHASKVIMHCFCGKWNLVKKIRDHGWFVTVPTNVVFSKQFQTIASEIPLTQLFCETDAPYLHPDKAWPNEPANVVRAYEMVALLKKLTLQEIKKALWNNYERLFSPS